MVTAEQAKFARAIAELCGIEKISDVIRLVVTVEAGRAPVMEVTRARLPTYGCIEIARNVESREVPLRKLELDLGERIARVLRDDNNAEPQS